MVSIIIPTYNNAKTLRKTLDSIRQQTYADFEAIVVNDGSTDESGSIAGEFAGADSRFVYIEQKNGGVSAARNRGLDAASRKYVMFVDGDDYLPPKALYFMHQVAVTNDADTIMGIFRRIDGTETVKYSRLERMIQRSLSVEKDNPDILRSWTLCNKWLSRDIIRDNDIRFHNYRHLEDAVFLYSYLNHAGKIYTCGHTVYYYVKPLPALGRTTTQNVNTALLSNADSAFEELKQITESYGDSFRQDLIRRYVHAPLIADYYRRIWMLDPSTAQLLTDSIDRYMSELDDTRRGQIVRPHRELFADDGMVKTRAELRKHPLAAVALTGGVGKEHVTDILDGLYDQYAVNFAAVVDERFRAVCGDKFDSCENLIWASEKDMTDAIAGTGAKYLMCIDADILLNHKTLFGAIRIMEDRSDVNAVRVGFNHYDGGSVKESALNEYICENDAFELDAMLAGKLFRCTGDVLGCIAAGRKEELLSKYRFEKLSSAKMLSLLSDEQIPRLSSAEKSVREYRKSLKKEAGDSGKIKARLRRILRRLKDGKGKKESKPKNKKNSAEDYYLNLDVVEGRVVVEGLGKRPKSSSLYLMKELTSGRYGDLDIFYIVTDTTEEETKAIFEREGIDNVSLILRDSDEYRRALFSAEYLFNEVDFPIWWIKKPGQTYVNLWHGTPIKKLGKEKSGVIHKDAAAAHNFTMADYMLMPSEYCIEHIMKDTDTFEIACGKALMLGYPRTGILFSEEQRQRVRRECDLDGKRVITWMPTWNDETKPEDIAAFLKEMDERLADDQILYVNLHHKTGASIDYSDYSKVFRFPDDYDTYGFLTAADVLISDYSSVFFDFAVTGRKIVLHCPDKDEYKAARGLYIDPEDTPFPVTGTVEELIHEIGSDKEYDDSAFLNEFNRYDSIDNAAKLCDVVMLGKTDAAEIRDFPVNENAVFIVADSFRPGKVSEWLIGIFDHGEWDSDHYLSFSEKAASAEIDCIEPMLRGVHIFATKGRATGERSERRRLYGDMRIRRFVLLDPENYRRIRAFCRFPEPVQLLLTDRQMDVLRSDDKDMLQAVKIFNKYGNGISVLEQEDAKWLHDNMDIDADIISTQKEFREKYFRTAKHDAAD